MSDPAEHTGTPQAAEAESLGKPGQKVDRSSIKPINADQIQVGERHRTAGLLWPMDSDWGGGWLRIRPATVTAVSDARDDHEDEIRKHKKVKQRFKPDQMLRGKPGTEVNRFTVVMCVVEWVEPEAPLRFRNKVVWADELDTVELREFIVELFLPELNLDTKVPPEDELNMTFLQHMLDGLEAVSKEPALEIAKVGKDYRLGLGGGVDYSDSNR